MKPLFFIWEFSARHPGIIAVLIAVAGEVVCDWDETTGKRAKLKKFFMALLVVGLAYELVEAAKTDRDAADAIERAAKAEMQVTGLNLRVEELRKANDEFAAKVQDIEKLPDGRTLFSGIVSGSAKNIQAKIDDAFEKIMQGSNAVALAEINEVINFLETPDPAKGRAWMSYGWNEYSDARKGYCYSLVAQILLNLGSNSAALPYAEKGVEKDASNQNLVILSKCELIIGVNELMKKNYDQSLALCIKAVNDYETAKKNGSDMGGYQRVINANGKEEYKILSGLDYLMPASDTSRMYLTSSMAAAMCRSNALAKEFAKEALAVDPTNAIVADWIKKIP